MYSTRKGRNQWFFGMKVHIGVDQDSRLIHTVAVTGANIHDVSMAAELVDGEEKMVDGDARPGQRRRLPETPAGHLPGWLERAKAHMRAKVEHPFRVIKLKDGCCLATAVGQGVQAADGADAQHPHTRMAAVSQQRLDRGFKPQTGQTPNIHTQGWLLSRNSGWTGGSSRRRGRRPTSTHKDGCCLATAVGQGVQAARRGRRPASTYRAGC